MSKDARHRNLTIAQDDADLIVRLRTPATGLNGTYLDGAPVARIADVFATPDWRDLAVEIAPGELRVEVDGELRARTTLPEAPLRNWNHGYPLALGNELTPRPRFARSAPPRGRIRRARRRGLRHPGVLDVPQRFWRAIGPTTLVPFGERSLRDAALNLAGYLPLGLFLGAWAGSRGWRAAWPIGLVFLISASFETLQFVSPTATPRPRIWSSTSSAAS